ncbi:MAG TPA: HAD family hydrolase [Xanthobacteraceae bacterium]|nr:HAD family hydrolase [Xanthobacteraceae bacterium]
MQVPDPLSPDRPPADMKRCFDLVIFDCDGVLVDSEVLSCQCLVEVLRRYDVALDLETAFTHFLGRSSVAIGDYYLGLGQSLPAEFGAALQESIRNSFARSLTATPNVEKLLRSLDIAYCLASSSDLERIHFSLRITGLRGLFEGRIFSAEMVPEGKPAPDLFLYAAARMGARPDRTLVIEDSVSGVRAAKAAGMRVWGFVGGSHYRFRNGRALLSAAGSDRVFERMLDFGQGVSGTGS